MVVIKKVIDFSFFLSVLRLLDLHMYRYKYIPMVVITSDIEFSFFLSVLRLFDLHMYRYEYICTGMHTYVQI